MVSAHSRIEWVWLHWSEYLLARDEFYRWFQKMTVVLEPPVELQLGLKEKQWQLSHSQVLLHNVDSQAVLLDRLLEEAASLFNRIGDPSVDEDAQKRMKAEYDAVKAKAQVGEGGGRSPCSHFPTSSSHPAAHLLTNHLSVHLLTIYYLPTQHPPTNTHPSVHPPKVSPLKYRVSHSPPTHLPPHLLTCPAIRPTAHPPIRLFALYSPTSLPTNLTNLLFV